MAHCTRNNNGIDVVMAFVGTYVTCDVRTVLVARLGAVSAARRHDKLRRKVVRG